MKKILGLTLLTLLSSTCTLAESSAKAPDLTGCLQMGYSPEGSTQLCLFDNQEFVIAGFGAAKYGTYQVDSQNQRVQLSFKNPQELYIYSTYDPTVQGTKIQFDGFADHDLSDVFVQFNERGIQPVIRFKNSVCIAYPYIHTLRQPLQSINFYLQDERNKTDIRQFHVDLSAKQNKLYVLYMDKKEQLEDMYFTYQLKGKKYQFFETDYTVIDGVRYFEKNDMQSYHLEPYEKDDTTFDEFKILKQLVTRPTGEQDIYFDSVFETYRRELDKNAYYLDTVSHAYRLTDEKKLDMLKQRMTTSLGYSEQEFNEYIANLSKQELQEFNSTFALEESYPPILWKYRYHQPKITVMTQFPQMIKQRPVFMESCQDE